MEQQSSQSDFGDLPSRQDPDVDALYRRYARRLIDLARHHLDQRLRGKVDPEDVMQSAFRSFCRRRAAGEWDGTDENALWPLLVRITIRKCHRRLEHFLTACRDVRREAGAADAASSAVDPEPTPEEAAMLADYAQAVMKRLNSERKRRIFALYLQGYNVMEISEAVGFYERGVERVRSEIRRLLQTMMTEEEL